MNIAVARCSVACAAVIFALVSNVPVFGECLHKRSVPLEPQTSTVAGNGYPRIADGPLLSASFVQPYGVAIATDGSIYVADGDANDVRRIHNGVVEIFAGAALQGRDRQQRIGGYRDGPALKAHFNRPTGVAVAKDGTVYVSDQANHMVRKISHGLVTTLAKNLTEPHGIAVDDDGNVYVADFGGGLQMIKPNGKLTTLTYSNNAYVCGVYARGSGQHRLLAFTDGKGINLVIGDTVRFLASAADAEPVVDEEHLVGPGCGIVAFDRNTVAISDAFDNAVRFVRFPMGNPVGAPPMVRIISGGRKAGSLAIGGYRDGIAEESLLDIPRGLALEHDGSILVADAGNRRIRKITGVDPRGPVLPNGDGTLAIATKPKNSYSVVVLGNSYTFANSLWPDSIAGQIESGLIRDRSAIGLKECPDVVTYRFSAGAITDLGSFMSTYYGDHEADLIVFLLDTGNLTKELNTIRPHPDPLGKSAEAISADWRIIQHRLRLIRNAVQRGGADFVIAALPDGRAVSPLENPRHDSLPDSLQDFYSDNRPAFQTYRLAFEFQDKVAASGVRTINVFEPLLQAEYGPVRVPLFNAEDYHPTIGGSMLIGQSILAGLERWGPWKRSQETIRR